MDWSNIGPRYGCTVFVVAAASLLDVIIEKATKLHLPVFLFMAVLFVGWYYGRGPAWLAATTSVLVFAYFFASPVYSFRIDSHGESIFVPFLLCIAAVLAISHIRGNSKNRTS